MRTLHEDLRKFMYCWILLEWEMFQTKAVERISTHIMFNKNVPHLRAVFWDNVEIYVTTRQGTGDTIIRLCALYAGYRLQTLGVCNTYSFATQQWLRECASLLRCTYITYVVNFRGAVWLTITVPHRKWDALQSDSWTVNARYHLLHEVLPDEVTLVFSQYRHA